MILVKFLKRTFDFIIYLALETFIQPTFLQSLTLAFKVQCKKDICMGKSQ